MVIKTANAITTNVMAMVNGDQNPLLTVTGAFVGLNPVDAPVNVLLPVDVPIGVGEATEPPLVTLKSALPVLPPASVALNAKLPPAETDAGTMKT